MFSNTFRWLIFILIVVLLCSFALNFTINAIRYYDHNSTAASAPAPTPFDAAPLAYGNGIYYFPMTDDQYMRSLAKFYQLFKNLRCDYQGHTEKWNGALLKTTGFILHCREGAVEAQSITVP